MTTIHHTIVKNAAKAGIVLSTEGTMHDDFTVIAHHMERNLKVWREIDEEDAVNDTAKDLWNDLTQAISYEAEHPGIRLSFADTDWSAHNVTDQGELGDHLASDPSLEDLIETLAEQEEAGAEAAMDAADDAEAEATGSVVPDKYKKLYASEGHPTHCGDWMAETLNRFCRVNDEKGKEVTDLDRLEAIANANAVAPARFGKLGVETNGWQGRFRMTIRNMLAPRVAEKGYLFVPEGCGADEDQELAAPADWIAKHLPKAKKTPAAVAKPDAPSGKKSAKAKAKETPASDGVAVATAAVKAARAKGNR